MEAGLDPGARFMVEDLLNFTLEGAGEEDDDYDENALKAPPSSSTSNSQDPDDHQSLSLPEFAEEELEWLSNKDAFPSVETCLDILSHHPGIASSHQSPVSVLESTTATTTTTTSTTSNNSSITSYCSSGSGGIILVPVRYPVKARSKRRRRRPGGFSEQYWSWGQEKPEFRPAPPPRGGTATMGRRCWHCGSDKTPQWRAGPMGPKTLCNACGVRYKSGRLVPEYRPASSPTFSNLLHSNSHRKVMEMRRQKQMAEMDSAL